MPASRNVGAVVAWQMKIAGASLGLVRFMAKNALALYCLHLFVMEPMKRLVARVSQDHLVATSMLFVLVILASYALAMFLGFYLKEEVIM